MNSSNSKEVYRMFEGQGLFLYPDPSTFSHDSCGHQADPCVHF